MLFSDLFCSFASQGVGFEASCLSSCFLRSNALGESLCTSAHQIAREAAWVTARSPGARIWQQTSVHESEAPVHSALSAQNARHRSIFSFCANPVLPVPVHESAPCLGSLQELMMPAMRLLRTQAIGAIGNMVPSPTRHAEKLCVPCLESPLRHHRQCCRCYLSSHGAQLPLGSCRVAQSIDISWLWKQLLCFEFLDLGRRLGFTTEIRLCNSWAHQLWRLWRLGVAGRESMPPVSRVNRAQSPKKHSCNSLHQS